MALKSTKIANLNKVRAASRPTTSAERSVLVFDYYAPESEAGQVVQRPLVRVIDNSLRKTDDGDWMFRGVNLYRVDAEGKHASAVRTYRISRIQGIARRPAE